jgi:uncharacterized protein (DUF302 family)
MDEAMHDTALQRQLHEKRCGTGTSSNTLKEQSESLTPATNRKEGSGMNAQFKLMSSFVLAGLLLSGTLALAQDAERVDWVSNKNFAATVKAVETVLQSNGFMVVATIDHQNMLKMVGASIKGSKTIEFGKAEMGKMLMPMAPEAGLEFPGRFYIWERADGKTVVSYRKPSAGLGEYGNEMVTKMGRDMDGMWEKFATEAAK